VTIPVTKKTQTVRKIVLERLMIAEHEASHRVFLPGIADCFLQILGTHTQWDPVLEPCITAERIKLRDDGLDLIGSSHLRWVCEDMEKRQSVARVIQEINDQLMRKMMDREHRRDSYGSLGGVRIEYKAWKYTAYGLNQRLTQNFPDHYLDDAPGTIGKPSNRYYDLSRWSPANVVTLENTSEYFSELGQRVAAHFTSLGFSVKAEILSETQSEPLRSSRADTKSRFTTITVSC